jgi:aryl-alcohol dehydrogenase-like predicted oxidoreductase
MQYRRLGKSNLQVSALCLDTAARLHGAALARIGG